MKIKISLAFLFLSSSALAYNSQEITKLIQQQSKTHHYVTFTKTQHALNWRALQGPRIDGQFIVVVMKNSNSLFFAYNSYNNELYKSTDAGQHWKVISFPTPLKIHHLISLDENRLLLSADNQIYLSKDQGEHWTKTATIDYSCDKLFSPTPNLVLLTTNSGFSRIGLYRSLDGGQTFSPAKLGIRDGFPFFVLGGRDNILLTGTDGIYISINKGLLWTQPSINWKDQLLYSAAINRQHDIFLATNNNLYKTDMSGKIWEKLNHDIGHVEMVKIDTQDRLYAVGIKEGYGLYRSLDQGKTWELLHSFKQVIGITILGNSNILVNTVDGLMESDESQLNYRKIEFPYPPSINSNAIALDKDHFFATATAYSGPLYASDNAGKNWSVIRNTAISNIAAFKGQIVALEYDGNHQQLSTSADFGRTWQIALPRTDNYCYSLSAQNDGLIINCNKDSYFTEDLANWITLKTEAAHSTSYFSGKLIYITDGNFIKSTNNHGLTWDYLLNNLNQYRAYIAGYHDEVLIIAIPFAGIIKMTDGGKNWDLINDGLTDYDFTSLVVIDPNNYVVSTYHGVFYTQDGGRQWMAENNGLNNLAVISLSLNQTTLLAGTEGSGVFKAELT